MQLYTLWPQHWTLPGRQDRGRGLEEEEWPLGADVVEFGNVIASHSLAEEWDARGERVYTHSSGQCTRPYGIGLLWRPSRKGRRPLNEGGIHFWTLSWLSRTVRGFSCIGRHLIRQSLRLAPLLGLKQHSPSSATRTREALGTCRHVDWHFGIICTEYSIGPQDQGKDADRINTFRPDLSACLRKTEPSSYTEKTC